MLSKWKITQSEHTPMGVGIKKAPGLLIVVSLTN
nr:MAG TPA: hypothetical protein [Caudoviricetes sp.]